MSAFCSRKYCGNPVTIRSNGMKAKICDVHYKKLTKNRNTGIDYKQLLISSMYIYAF